MSQEITLKLARFADAQSIALLSRDLIEVGLGWRWNAVRVAAQIQCPDTSVVVAYCHSKEHQKQLIGFAIMHFGQDVAHLLLLAVHPAWQRLGVGRRLIDWLEKSARVAGISRIMLEVRNKNTAAQAFYQALGYRSVKLLPRYYNGHEAALCMAHDLRVAL